MGRPTVGETMAATNTDGWMVVHDGQVVAEQYAGAMDPATRHLLMSVSKSLVGILVGALVGEGALDVDGRSPRTFRSWSPAAIAGPRYATCSTCVRASTSPRTTSIPTPRSASWSRRSDGHRASSPDVPRTLATFC